jgi:hypothetical protein
MKESPTWQADTESRSAGQNITRLLWKTKFHYNSPLLEHILSQMRSIHALTDYLISILILSSNIHLYFPSGLFPSGFPSKILYAFII